MIVDSYESKDELIDSFRNEFEPLSDEEIERWLAGSTDFGVETSEEDIDDVLYRKQEYEVEQSDNEKIE